MDWLQKIEQKKKIKKLAGRVLLQDVKALICGWKVIMLAAVILCYIVMPYIEDLDGYNEGVACYVGVLFCTMLLAGPEQVFFFLPMTQEDIRRYLIVRNNLISAGMTAVSAVVFIFLKLFGVPFCLERGLSGLLLLLFLLEGVTASVLYDYREKPMKEEHPLGKARKRKKRAVCYFCLGIVMLLYRVLVAEILIAVMTEHRAVFLFIDVVCYVSIVLIRMDIMRWTDFTEYQQRRNLLWGYYWNDSSRQTGGGENRA